MQRRTVCNYSSLLFEKATSHFARSRWRQAPPRPSHATFTTEKEEKISFISAATCNAQHGARAIDTLRANFTLTDVAYART